MAGLGHDVGRTACLLLRPVPPSLLGRDGIFQIARQVPSDLEDFLNCFIPSQCLFVQMVKWISSIVSRWVLKKKLLQLLVYSAYADLRFMYNHWPIITASYFNISY